MELYGSTTAVETYFDTDKALMSDSKCLPLK